MIAVARVVRSDLLIGTATIWPFGVLSFHDDNTLSATFGTGLKDGTCDALISIPHYNTPTHPPICFRQNYIHKLSDFGDRVSRHVHVEEA